MRANSIIKYLKDHKVISRWTTFNGALQAALAVPETYDAEKHSTALRVLEQDPQGELLCVYCDQRAATWDHLENNVRNGRFSGYGNRIMNLVPSCRTCNEKKGQKPWRTFVESRADTQNEIRIRRLSDFADKNSDERFGWDDIEEHFPELAARYKKIGEELRAKLREADQVAAEIRDKVRGKRGAREEA